jgi:light-regulated signal transduction histidine kinase (bacteriophytochrome)
MNDLRAAVVSTAGGLAVLLLLGSLLLGRAWRARDDAKAEVAVHAQELERANTDLSRSNKELEQFAYVASHDLSEPLRAISGPISLVARRYQGQLDDEADQFIGFAVDGCQRMQKMIDDLLVYSRIGRLERSFEPTDCNLVVDAVLTALGPAISETGAVIHVEQLPVVLAEATQLSQVFQNLIANALKFVATDVTPEVAVAAEPAGAQWRFTITDNGIGIDPAHRERIFAMFKRLHSREDYPGTGIGLALAKKIVERHGGRIGVEDAPNRTGTRFWFTLKAEEAR